MRKECANAIFGSLLEIARQAVGICQTKTRKMVGELIFDFLASIADNINWMQILDTDSGYI